MLRTAIGRPLLLLLVAVSSCPVAIPQEKPPETKPAQFLPSSLGEPFTVVPIDLPDVECAVLQWEEQSSAVDGPVLTLLCPPPQIFAPLRVLLKLSWQASETASLDPDDILVAPGEKTHLRTRKDCAYVRLDVLNEKGRAQRRWVPFTAVADVALLPKLPSRKRKPSP